MEQIIGIQDYQDYKSSTIHSNAIQPFYISLKIVLQNKEQFRCVQNNLAVNICSNQHCQKPGLICGQWKCECQNTHKKCNKTVFIWRVIESILSKKQNLPQKVKQSYQALSQNIDKIIEELSQLRFNLQSQQQYFGLFKSELKFVDLVKANKIDQISGKLINQMQNTFEAQVKFGMLSKELIEKDFQQKRKQFSKLCKEIQYKYSKKQQSIQFAGDIFQDSKILIQNQDKQFLTQWIKQIPDHHGSKTISSKLLFRGSQHEFQAQKFFKFCEDKEDTIIVVRNQYGKTFGGFTHAKWKKGLIKQFFIPDNTKKSFIFSLDQKLKIPCTNHQKSICYNPIYGPLFGVDLGVHDKAHLKQYKTFAPFNSYNISLIDKKYQVNQATYTLLTGNPTNIYKVTQYQVYQILGLNLQ